MLKKKRYNGKASGLWSQSRFKLRLGCVVWDKLLTWQNCSILNFSIAGVAVRINNSPQ